MSESSMTEIIPGLWLGNLRSRCNTKALTVRRIACVINCCRSCSLKSEKHFNDSLDTIPPLPSNIEQVNLNIIERGPGDINSFDSMKLALPLAIDIIDRNLTSGKSVLVHCYAGRQRSPAVIVGYLVHKCNYTVEEAYEIVSALWVYTGTDYLECVQQYFTSVKSDDSLN